jgi:hypothetical protein
LANAIDADGISSWLCIGTKYSKVDARDRLALAPFGMIDIGSPSLIPARPTRRQG